VGDWAIFNGATWDKVDNTDAVSSVNGFTGAVSLTTANISEVTNLYYTDVRVSANTDVAANTAARHAAVTLGTANGLSLSTQALSLGLASTSATGALSSTDWNTFNLKQAALSGTGFVKISGSTISYDNSTYLTTSAASSTYLALAGGTLTGALGGTSASFSSTGRFIGALTIGTDFAQLLPISSSNYQLLVGSYYDGTNIIATATSGSRTVYNIGGMDFRTFTGATVGGIVTDISRFSIIASTGAAAFTSSVTLTNGRINLLGNTSDSKAIMIMGDATYPTASIVAPNTGGTILIAGQSGTGMTIGTSGQATFISTISGTSIRSSAVGTFGFNTANNGEFQIYATALDGMVMAGRGSTNDMVITNKSGSDVLRIPTGTTGVTLVGALTGTSATFSSSVTAGDIILGNSNILSWGGVFGANIPSIVGVNGASGYLAIYPAGSTGGEKFRITNGGNVLIGTTSDNTHKLQISAANPFMTYTSTAISRTFLTGVNSNGYVIYDDNASAYRMAITTGGNVLIGTTTDSGYKLDVNGTGRFTSRILAGNSIFIGEVVSSFSLLESTSGNGIWLRPAGGSDPTGLKIATTGAATFNSTVTATSYNRAAAGTGFLNGKYGSAESVSTTGPIYCIGDSYVPTSTSINSMFGIGYSYNQFTGKFGPADTWGMYVATNGSVGVFLAGGGAGYFAGAVTATGFFESSDKRIKTLIEDNYQTKGIGEITPKLYTKNGKVELGYYAQDFVGILDSAVSKGSDDMLSLSYREVHTAKIYALEQEIKELKAKIN
jgi:hypothetical protein